MMHYFYKEIMIKEKLKNLISSTIFRIVFISFFVIIVIFISGSLIISRSVPPIPQATIYNIPLLEKFIIPPESFLFDSFTLSRTKKNRYTLQDAKQVDIPLKEKDMVTLQNEVDILIDSILSQAP